MSFAFAFGSVPGRSHVLAGKPNQDAFVARIGEAALVTVVCDGCGSGAHSELGARIGANAVAERSLAAIQRGDSLASDEVLERVRLEVLEDLFAVMRVMGGRSSTVVTEHFLFTVLAVAIEKEKATIFGIGDGVYAVDGEVVAIGPFEGNAPPYLGYALLGSAGPSFVIHRAMPVDSAARIAIATDGAMDLDPSIAEIAADPRCFANRDTIRRTLTLVARKKPGLVEDDTTVAVLRRS